MDENNTLFRGSIDPGHTTDMGIDAVPIHPPVRGRRIRPALGLSKGRLAKLRLRTVHDLDKRTRSYRHAMAVVSELTAAFGGNPSTAQRQAIEQVAMLETVANDLMARQIAGLSVNLDEALRAGNAARRARAAVLANRPEPKPTERPGLRIARARWAEQAAARNATKKEKLRCHANAKRHPIRRSPTKLSNRPARRRPNSWGWTLSSLRLAIV